MSERIELTLFVATVLVGAALWWAYYVRPNDALLRATAECVHAKGALVSDRAAFDGCYGGLVGQAGGLVPLFHAR